MMHDFLQFKVFQSCLNQHFVQSGDPLNVRNIERIRARHWHGIVHGLKKKNANLLQMPGGSKKRHVRHVDLFRSRIKHAARVLSLSRVYLEFIFVLSEKSTSFAHVFLLGRPSLSPRVE